jgi:hypothetical protein
MNLEADNTILEDYGAGFEGTNALRDKYIKDTPGQKIRQFKTTMKDSKEKLETEIEEAKDPKQAADFQRVIYGLMKQDDYNKKWKLGKYRPAGNKLAGPGGLYKNLLMPSKKESELEEALQEAVPKIDVEELLDAAVKMRKEFPQLRKGQSIMITLHNMNPTMYSMAAAKHDAFTVDAKIPDLINFLDPKYYAESANLDEAMEPQNTSYGYYGTVDVEKYKLIAYKEMADKVLKIVRAKKIFVNFSNITSNADQESAVVKYLDSKHGRHIADGNDSPAYIEKDFTKFLKDFAAGHYMESSGLEEGRFFNVRDYMATSEKSQFGGYRPKVVNKAGKTLYLSAAAYNTPDEAKDHAEEYLKQYARGISEPRVPIKGTYVKESETLDESNQEVFIAGESAGLDVSEISSLMSQALKKYNNPNKAKSELISIFKMIKDSKKDLSKFYGDFSSLSSAVYESKEISLEERRQMKIVALATGSTDLDKIYEYVTSQPVQYSSVVELKESFNKYINTP